MNKTIEYYQLLMRIIELSNSLLKKEEVFTDKSEPSEEFSLLLDLRDQAVDIAGEYPEVKYSKENVEIMKLFRETDAMFGELLKEYYQDLKEKTSKIQGYKQLRNSYEKMHPISNALFYDDKG